MIDLDKEDMDAVERAFAEEERAERRERVLDVLSGVLTVAAALAFLALCWLLIRSREAADAERRARSAGRGGARGAAADGGGSRLPALPPGVGGRVRAPEAARDFELEAQYNFPLMGSGHRTKGTTKC